MFRLLGFGALGLPGFLGLMSGFRFEALFASVLPSSYKRAVSKSFVNLPNFPTKASMQIRSRICSRAAEDLRIGVLQTSRTTWNPNLTGKASAAGSFPRPWTMAKKHFETCYFRAGVHISQVESSVNHPAAATCGHLQHFYHSLLGDFGIQTGVHLLGLL